MTLPAKTSTLHSDLWSPVGVVGQLLLVRISHNPNSRWSSSGVARSNGGVQASKRNLDAA
jgi:hypothetical protein